MSELITLTKLNETDMKIGCEFGILMELKDAFTFFVDNAKWTPAYKMGTWDGYLSPME